MFISINMLYGFVYYIYLLFNLILYCLVCDKSSYIYTLQQKFGNSPKFLDRKFYTYESIDQLT